MALKGMMAVRKHVMRCRIGVAAISASSMIFPIALLAQATPVSPSFEIASVKQHDANIRQNVNLRIGPGGRLSITNLELKYIIERAYDLKDYQVIGEPAWLLTDRFDIDAKATGDPGEKEMLRMLQTLLADRFRLQVHRTTKRGDVFELVVSKRGPKLQASTSNQPPWVGYGPKGSASDDKPAATYEVVGKHAPVSLLATHLPLQLPVLDKTGIRGFFDFTFEYAPDPTQTDLNAALPAAMEEALGLKLKPAKGPIDCLVIDHVERPSKN